MDAAATWVALLAIGLAAGFLSTLYGIGGGLVVVPLLHYGLGLGFLEATAVSLVAMAIQTPVGLATHVRRKAVDWRIGGLLAAGGAVGVPLGHWLQPHAPMPALKALLGLAMLAAAWRLWVQLRAARTDGIPWLPLLALGVLAGVVSRLVGIGGGLVTVPVLVLLGTAMHAAVASSLLPVATNAILATAAIAAEGQADLRVALPLALAALVAAPLGTLVAHALAARRLQRAFALALAAAAVYVLATSAT